MFAARIVPGASGEVIWQYPVASPLSLGSFPALTDINIEFSATSTALGGQPGMNYTVVAGSIPPGPAFVNYPTPNPLDDFAYLDGEVFQGPAPVWVSPAAGLELAELGELQDITPFGIVLNAGPTPPASSIRYYVRSGTLPLGILIDGNTGDITGIAAQLVGQFPPVVNANPPVWNSPAAAASLGTFSEREGVSLVAWESITFFGTPTGFYIVEGGLPLGLVMSYANGDITGTTAELVDQPTPPDATPPAVVANSYAESVSVAITPIDISSQFTPTPPRTMVGFFVVEGSLPRGLVMDYTTGVVTGTPIVVEVAVATIRGIDSEGGHASANFTFTIS